MKDAIEVLVTKAQTAIDATEALKFSQAAVNLSHVEERQELTRQLKERRV